MTSDLTDSQWARLEPLLAELPTPSNAGRPRSRSRRELIDGVRWRFQQNASWKRLPAKYGPYQTVYAFFYAWREDGTWERLAAALGDAESPEDDRILPWVRHGDPGARRPE